MESTAASYKSHDGVLSKHELLIGQDPDIQDKLGILTLWKGLEQGSSSLT